MAVAPERDLKLLGTPDDDSQRTFVFRNEDHTLGNSLRHVLMQKCVFCFLRMNHRQSRSLSVSTRTSAGTRCRTRRSR